ncbi:unnamed protein product, partial [Rotaria sp. Silwood1]
MAEESYYKAMKEIPTGWKAVGQDLLRTSIHLVPMVIGAAVGGLVGVTTVSAGTVGMIGTLG